MFLRSAAISGRRDTAFAQAFLGVVAAIVLLLAAPTAANAQAPGSGKVNLSDAGRQAAANAPIRMIVVLQANVPADPVAQRRMQTMRADTTVKIDGFIARIDARRVLPTRMQERIARRYAYAPFLAMELSTSEATAMAADNDVRVIVEDRLTRLSLVSSAPVIQAPAVWDLGQEGYGATVAILDSGVDLDHSMMAGKIVGSICYSSTTSNTRTLCPNGAEEQLGGRGGDDCAAFQLSGCDHGTHVAGIAAGRSVTSTGGTTYRGIAPSAGVVAAQVFSQRLSDNTIASFTSDQIAAFDWLLPRVSQFNLASINMSLGGDPASGPCDSDPLKFYVDQMRAQGVTTVIAAGNDASTVGVSEPACISNALSVGATNNSDAIASFSNTGSMLDVLAPGVGIISAVPGQLLGTKSGTSMATPHVAGAVALLKAAQPGATPDQIESALKSTGVALTDSRNALTRSRINVLAALNALGGTSGARLNVTPNTVASFTLPFGGSPSPASRTYTVTNPGAAQITARVTASSSVITLSGAGQSGATLEFPLGPSASEVITVSPVTGQLPLEIVTAEMAFTAVGGLSTTRGVRLDVQNPISVAPTTLVTLVGPVGGPFRAVESVAGDGSAAYTLSNAAGGSVALTATADETWVVLSAQGSSGRPISFSAPTGSSPMTASASVAANAFGLGLRRATVTVDSGISRIATRTLDLRVTVANDLFANAAAIPKRAGEVSPVVMTATGSNTNSYFEAGEPAPVSTSAARRSVWYRFTAAFTGPVRIDTAGSNFDTVLAAYTGGSVSTLTQLASSDDIVLGSILTSQISFNVVQGVTYHVVVDGFGGDTGAYVLNVQPEAPANDSVAGAVALSGASGAVTAVTFAATRAADEPAHNGRATGRSVWFTWTSPATGPATFRTLQNDHDTTLSVYAAAPGGGFVEVASNDNGAGLSSGGSSATFSVAAGQAFLIALDVKNLNQAGLANLDWSVGGAASPLLASTSPASRRTVLGRPVTIFANMLNNGPTPVANCSVAAPLSFGGAFSYQTASALNDLTGSPNTPAAAIPAGGIQNFVLTATASTAITAGELGLVFDCDGVDPAPVFVGTNSWLLRADAAASTPDIIAIGATQGTPGVITLPPGGATAYALAAVNIGAAVNQVLLQPDADNPGPAWSISACETNPSTGVCKQPPSALVVVPTFATDEIRTFTLFVQHTGGQPIPFDPANTRIRAVFVDSLSNTLGSTSAAVRTQ